MNKKILAILIPGIMIGAAASTQTIKDYINKAHNSKDAKDKSAKADVIIMPKTVSDSSSANAAEVKMVSKPAIITKSKTKSKKGKYKHKRKTSS